VNARLVEVRRTGLGVGAGDGEDVGVGLGLGLAMGTESSEPVQPASARTIKKLAMATFLRPTKKVIGSLMRCL
jgi:hypothetical protein